MFTEEQQDVLSDWERKICVKGVVQVFFVTGVEFARLSAIVGSRKEELMAIEET